MPFLILVLILWSDLFLLHLYNLNGNLLCLHKKPQNLNLPNSFSLLIFFLFLLFVMRVLFKNLSYLIFFWKFFSLMLIYNQNLILKSWLKKLNNILQLYSFINNFISLFFFFHVFYIYFRCFFFSLFFLFLVLLSLEA